MNFGLEDIIDNKQPRVSVLDALRTKWRKHLNFSCETYFGKDLHYCMEFLGFKLVEQESWNRYILDFKTDYESDVDWVNSICSKIRDKEDIVYNQTLLTRYVLDKETGRLYK